MISKCRVAAKRRRGRPRKLTDHQTFPLRLPRELHRQLRHHAIDAGSSLNDILVDVIERWWNNMPKNTDDARSKD